MPEEQAKREAIESERYETLEQVKALLEPIVLFLGFVWLVLLVIELTWGSSRPTQILFWVIWFVFLVDFLLRFFLAPRKLEYLRANWLTSLSLFVPALRVFRLARVARVLYAARATRSMAMLRVISSLNRGLRALRAHMGRRGIGFIVALSIIVLLVGAASMYFFERSASGGGFRDFWDALYWTSMMLTTMGSQYWPETGEGRVLAFLLSLYAFTMFGYITATLATFFIGREAESEESELSTLGSIQALRDEVAALRAEVRALGPQPSSGNQALPGPDSAHNRDSAAPSPTDQID